jgi:hypothetical protein
MSSSSIARTSTVRTTESPRMYPRVAMALLVLAGCGRRSESPDGAVPCSWVMGTPVELSGMGGSQYVSLLQVEGAYLLAEDVGAQTFVSRAPNIEASWTTTAMLDTARVSPTFVLLDAPYLVSALNNAPVRSQILAQRFAVDGTLDGAEATLVDEGSHVFAAVARNASELFVAYVDYSADDSFECLTSSTSGPCLGVVSTFTWTTGGATSPTVAQSGPLVYSDESPRKVGVSVVGGALTVGWTEMKVGSEAIRVAEHPSAAPVGTAPSPRSRYLAMGSDGAQPLVVWENAAGGRLVPADNLDGQPVAEIAGGHVENEVSVGSGHGVMATVIEDSLLLTDPTGTAVIALPAHAAGTNTSIIAGPGPAPGFIVVSIGLSDVAQGVVITCE